MQGLHSHGIAIIVSNEKLKHQRVQHGIASKRLACHRRTQLGVETSLRRTENRIFDGTNKCVRSVFRGHRIRIGMTNDFNGVGMEKIDIIVVRNQVVSDGLGRFSARREG